MPNPPFRHTAEKCNRRACMRVDARFGTLPYATMRNPVLIALKLI